MVWWTRKPGSSSGGAGKWPLAEARRGIIPLHRRRRGAPLILAKPCGAASCGADIRVWAGLGCRPRRPSRRKCAEKKRVARHRPKTSPNGDRAPGSGLGKDDPRHPSSFSHTIGWPLVHAGTNRRDNLNFDWMCCHCFNIPRATPSKAPIQPAVAPCTARMFNTRVCPKGHRTLLAAAEILPTWSVNWRGLACGGMVAPKTCNIPHAWCW